MWLCYQYQMHGLPTFCRKLKLFIIARDQQFEILVAELDMKFNKLRVEMHKVFSQAGNIFYQIGANLNCTLE